MHIQDVTKIQHFIRSKVPQLTLMMKHPKHLDAFSSLGDILLEKSCIKTIEEFTCLLYGYSRMTNTPCYKKQI